MSPRFFASFVAAAMLAASSTVTATVEPWINEFHYRPKENMFVEIAGPADQSANGLSLTLYQGRDGEEYPPTIDLSGKTFSEGVDTNAGIGFLTVPLPLKVHKGNQIADGLALIRNNNECLQFVSYGGSFAAASGACQGTNSNDVGIEEPRGNTATTSSIQLQGTGNKYRDFQWWDQLKTSTPGRVNEGQHLTSGSSGRRLR